MLPSLPAQSDGRGKRRDVLDAPHGLGSQTGGATGATGAVRGAATVARAACLYQGPEYPKGVAAASAVGGSGTYGWCWYGVSGMPAPCGGTVAPSPWHTLEDPILF